MPSPQIIIKRRGRLANNMFQVMIALELQSRVPDAYISGMSLPEWDIHFPVADPAANAIVATRHEIKLDELSWLLRTRAIEAVVIHGWGMRLYNFGPPSRYRKLFQPTVSGESINEDQLLIAVRAADILDGKNLRYYPNCFSFYEHVINETGLEPVFMGQLDDNDYISRLKRKFKGAKFLPGISPLDDFETIRNAKHVVLGISSFIWLASWLSEQAESIHLPVTGLYNPMVSGAHLLPVYDKRYQFYSMEIPDMEQRKAVSPGEWAEKYQEIIKFGNVDVQQHFISRALGYQAMRVN